MSEFAQHAAAFVLYLVFLVAPIAAGIYSGIWASKRWRSTLLHWAIGLAAWLAVGLVVGLVASSIPGIGWRFSKMVQLDEFSEEPAYRR